MPAFCGNSAGREHQLEITRDDDFIALLDAALDDDPTAVVDTEIRIESNRLVGIFGIATKDDRSDAIAHDRVHRNRKRLAAVRCFLTRCEIKRHFKRRRHARARPGKYFTRRNAARHEHEVDGASIGIGRDADGERAEKRRAGTVGVRRDHARRQSVAQTPEIALERACTKAHLLRLNNFNDIGRIRNEPALRDIDRCDDASGTGVWP